MFHLTYELQCMIMSFLPNDNLHPVSKESQQFYLSNVVWKPRVLRRFGEILSTNYFKEYCWQLQLERHQFCYKRQWTLVRTPSGHKFTSFKQRTVCTI